MKPKTCVAVIQKKAEKKRHPTQLPQQLGTK